MRTQRSSLCSLLLLLMPRLLPLLLTATTLCQRTITMQRMDDICPVGSWVVHYHIFWLQMEAEVHITQLSLSASDAKQELHAEHTLLATRATR